MPGESHTSRRYRRQQKQVCARQCGGRPERILVIENDTRADLEAAVTRYLDDRARPRAATFAVAAPVDGEEIALTNRQWRFRRGDFGRRFGFSPFVVVNDFEAIAWALPRLGAADTRPLGQGNPAPRGGAKVVLGPGTGLGRRRAGPADGRWRVVASEGGHARSVQAADEAEVFARLREQSRAVSAETVLSGPGLLRLARALDPRAQYREPETIVASALAREPSALAAARLFVRLLGRFAGDVALPSRRWAGSTSPAVSPAGWGRCSTSRSSAMPSRRTRPTRRCWPRSRSC